MDVIEREFPYRPRWILFILSGLFFSACAAFLGWKARTNMRGLIIDGVIELSPRSATVFYGILAILSCGFVAIAIIFPVLRLARPQRIAFTSAAIAVPRSRWSSDEIQVPFSSIERIEAMNISGQKFIRIHHPGGKCSIASSMLPSNQVYEEILKLLSERIQQAR